MKSDIHLRMDVDVIKLAKAKEINISNVCETYLKEYLDIDEKKVPNKKDLLIVAKTKSQAETNLIDEKLRQIKVKEEKEQKEEQEKRNRGKRVRTLEEAFAEPD